MGWRSNIRGKYALVNWFAFIFLGIPRKSRFGFFVNFPKVTLLSIIH